MALEIDNHYFLRNLQSTIPEMINGVVSSGERVSVFRLVRVQVDYNLLPFVGRHQLDVDTDGKGLIIRTNGSPIALLARGKLESLEPATPGIVNVCLTAKERSKGPEGDTNGCLFDVVPNDHLLVKWFRAVAYHDNLDLLHGRVGCIGN